MGTVSGMGGHRDTFSPDQFAQMVNEEAPSDRIVYSIEDSGEIEIFYYNAVFNFDEAELAELKSLLPDVEFVEYPSGIEADEIDDTMNFLRDQDILADLAEEADEDYDAAVSSLISILKSPPEQRTPSFPEWMPRDDDAYLDQLARGVLHVLGSKPKTPNDVVEKLLGS